MEEDLIYRTTRKPSRERPPLPSSRKFSQLLLMDV
jgi:hypothetical protein